jgi:Xaa-Pro aminopeptidase
MIQNRIEKIRDRMRVFDVEAVVIFTHSDIFYFTGINELEGILVITLESEMFFSSPLFGQLAKEKLRDKSAVTVTVMNDVVGYLKKEGIKSVGLDFLDVKMQYKNDLSDFKIKDFTNQTKIIRMIKENDEINNIKRAAIASRNAFMKIFPYLVPGKTEKEIADELTYQMRKAGAQKVAFETIVASGPNAAYPHHMPTNKKIQKGEFLMIDFGSNLDGYNSDNTYTFLIGEKDDEKRKLFNAVFYAQLFATEMIAPKRTRVKEIEERARKELSKYDLDKFFIHSLGHGVGIDVHEFPYINSKNDIVVEPNMVFTIEPGIYIPGKLGIRLENMILVKETDVEVIAFTPFMEAM